MAEINSKDVMKLRNETGLPMMDCKAALAESKGDFEAATDWLRKKMKGKMDKRTDRAAGEGRIGIAVNERSGVAAMVEVRAESDFTAENDNFVKAVQKIAQQALETGHAGELTPTAEMTAVIDEIR